MESNGLPTSSMDGLPQSEQDGKVLEMDFGTRSERDVYVSGSVCSGSEEVEDTGSTGHGTNQNRSTTVINEKGRQTRFASEVSAMSDFSVYDSNKPLRSAMRGTNRIRVDCYGNDIVIRPEGQPKNKNNPVPQKITYRDQISLKDADPNPEKQILSEVILVESYKKYNAELKPNDEGCCTIF